MKNFTVRLTLTGMLATLMYHFIVPLLSGSRWFFEYHFIIGILILLVTLLFHRALEAALKKSNASFVRTYMGGSGLRLAAFLMVILFFAFFRRAELGAFTLSFFWYYLVFTSFEVITGYKRFGSKPS